MTALGEQAHPWLPVSTCSAALCLPRSARGVGAARRAGRWTALTAVLVAGVVFAPAVRGRRVCATAVRLWTRALVRATGVRLRVRYPPAATAGGARGDGGRPRGPVAGPALVVANHISWLDVPLLAAVRPGRMLAKAEVAGYPVLGRLAAYGGTLFIDRERLRALPGTVAGLASLLRAGSSVVAFPEGSTWCGRDPGGAFRHAVFQAALDAGVPVQPMSVRYRTDEPGGAGRTAVTAFVGQDTLLASVRRVIAARGVVAEVTVLPPLRPGEFACRAALAGVAGRAIDAAGNLPLPGSRTRPGEGEGEKLRWRRTGTTRSTARRPVRATGATAPARRSTAVRENASAPTASPRVPAPRRPPP